MLCTRNLLFLIFHLHGEEKEGGERDQTYSPLSPTVFFKDVTGGIYIKWCYNLGFVRISVFSYIYMYIANKYSSKLFGNDFLKLTQIWFLLLFVKQTFSEKKSIYVETLFVLYNETWCCLKSWLIFSFEMEASDLGVSFEKRITNVYTILYNSFDKEVQTLVLN